MSKKFLAANFLLLKYIAMGAVGGWFLWFAKKIIGFIKELTVNIRKIINFFTALSF